MNTLLLSQHKINLNGTNTFVGDSARIRQGIRHEYVTRGLGLKKNLGRIWKLTCRSTTLFPTSTVHLENEIELGRHLVLNNDLGLTRSNLGLI